MTTPKFTVNSIDYSFDNLRGTIPAGTVVSERLPNVGGDGHASRVLGEEFPEGALEVVASAETYLAAWELVENTWPGLEFGRAEALATVTFEDEWTVSNVEIVRFEPIGRPRYSPTLKTLTGAGNYLARGRFIVRRTQ